MGNTTTDTATFTIDREGPVTPDGTAFAGPSEVLFDILGVGFLEFPATNFPADGQYAVSVYVRDQAGNLSTLGDTMTIDRDAHWDGTAFSGATETFVSIASGQTLPLAAASFPADGSYTVRAESRDFAGNLQTDEATFTMTAPCSAPGSVTVGAAADSWMLQSSATSNYGTDSVLKVDSKSGADARALVRFNLPAIPAGCEVVDADLRMYASSYKPDRTLQVLRVGATWAEGSVTWNNQPATTGAAATISSGLGYLEWNVTSQVGEMYAGGQPRVPDP